MVRSTLVVLVGLLSAGAAPASWADAMFKELSMDFGSVQRGPTLHHSFRVTNNTKENVHIAGVRVSCGCVSASATDNDLAPGQETTIEAQMDTRRFSGHKAVTVFVQFDRPQWEEVRLLVQANGRDDLVVTPDTLAFGRVHHGASPSASATVSFMGSGWRVEDARAESNYVKVALKDLRRQEGEVAYEVVATLRPDTPVGKWYTDVWLKTNDGSRVRLPLTVDVESALAVTPETVSLGEVQVGKEAERRVIIRGAKPFRITAVKGEDGALKVKDGTRESKAIHVLTLTLRPTETGEWSRKVRVVTDLDEDNEVEFQARAQVVK